MSSFFKWNVYSGPRCVACAKTRARTRTMMWESSACSRSSISCFCDEKESRSLILLITHVQLTARWRCWLKMPQKWEHRSSAGGVCGWFSGQVFVKMLCLVFSFSTAEFMHHSLEAVNKESLSMKTACAFILNLSVNEQQTQQTNPPGWTDTVKLFIIILYYTVFYFSMSLNC